MSTSKRFKTLEETFNLPSIDDEERIENALTKSNQIEDKFLELRDFEEHDREMDELAKLAVDAHKDLQELGMNVEIRHAGEIFASSGTMLKIAVDAKNNKVEKKLKLLKLQLEKMKIDLTFNTDDNGIDGTAMKLDRNELIKQLKQINDNPQS